MKKLSTLLAAIFCLSLLAGCAPKQRQYTATYLDLFDTVTYIVGTAGSEAEFQAAARDIHDRLLEYHRLFDIYNEYEGITNLKTVNEQAGRGPVTVDGRIIALLQDCRDYAEATGGSCNIAMGSVLRLWHEAREEGISDPENARLPDAEALRQAAENCDINKLIIDEAASTVFFADPELRLDVGAVAKGWAVQQVCEDAPTGILVSVGGNIYTTGPKDAGGAAWGVAIQHPFDAEQYLHTLDITGGSVVTSGSYQRRYTVDGRDYHHIIDPDTLYPGELWSSVTVICADSGMADALSTALFLLPREDGQRLLDESSAEALWVSPNGEEFFSPGFQEYIRK